MDTSADLHSQTGRESCELEVRNEGTVLFEENIKIMCLKKNHEADRGLINVYKQMSTIQMRDFKIKDTLNMRLKTYFIISG